jgi:hypothetical protein
MRQTNSSFVLRTIDSHHDERFERELSFATHTSVLMTLALDAPDDSVLMMLFGFAIENLLKGLYVSTLKNAKRPRTLNELECPAMGSLSLRRKLKRRWGEQFSESEIKLLTDLEQTIVWRGRYPSPVDADRLISTSSDTLFSAPSFQYPEHHFAASKLYDRLEALLIPRAPFSVQKILLGKTYLGRMPGDAG